jgi:hypothetical protein
MLIEGAAGIVMLIDCYLLRRDELLPSATVLGIGIEIISG